MTSDLYNQQGEKVENVLTTEEVEQRIAEEKAKLQEELEAKRQDETSTFLQEKEQLEAEKAELEAKLTGLDDKALNFKTLREKAEVKDKKIDELTKKIEGIEGTFTKKIEELSAKQLLDIKEDLLADLDKDTREKVEFHYKSFTAPATKEELRQRIQNAKILSQGGKRTLSGSVISSAGGVGNVFQGQSKEKFDNPEAVEVAKKMGLTDKEIKEAGLI